MHSKNIKNFGCYALIAGLVLGGSLCSPWFASSLFASTNYTVSPVSKESPLVITMPPSKTQPPIVVTMNPIVRETPLVMTMPPSKTKSPVVVTIPPIKTAPPATVTMVPTITVPPIVTKTPSVTTFKSVTQTSSTPIPTSGQTSKNTSVSSTDKPIVTEVVKQEGIIQRFYVGKKQYYTNDKKNEMDIAPVVKGGRTLMPIRYVSETFGANVDWNSTDRKVTISFGKKLVELWIGKDAAIVDGTLRRLDVAPEIIGGRTVLPLRFVSENLGLKVIWDEDLKEIKITN